jgi:hypothetical protein
MQNAHTEPRQAHEKRVSPHVVQWMARAFVCLFSSWYFSPCIVNKQAKHYTTKQQIACSLDPLSLSPPLSASIALCAFSLVSDVRVKRLKFESKLRGGLINLCRCCCCLFSPGVYVYRNCGRNNFTLRVTNFPAISISRQHKPGAECSE